MRLRHRLRWWWRAQDVTEFPPPNQPATASSEECPTRLESESHAAEFTIPKRVLATRKTNAEWWMAGNQSRNSETGSPVGDPHSVALRGAMITTKDVRILNGKSVELICFAQFSVYIHLQGQILLTVEADFEYLHGNTQERQLTVFPVSQSSLMRLLECSVVSATVETDGRLQLIFSNGDGVTVSKRLEFESYQIRIGAEELIA